MSLETVLLQHPLTEEQKKLLTAEFLTEARVAFNLFDKNGDGQITSDEIKEIYSHQKDQRSNEDIILMVKDFDKDGDNQLSFEEFVVMLLLSQDENKDDVDSFKLFDTNDDGFIDFQEFFDAHKRFGIVISETEARTKFSGADVDSDGKISFPEFLAIIKSE